MDGGLKAPASFVSLKLKKCQTLSSLFSHAFVCLFLEKDYNLFRIYYFV